ncbi:uncharacterized protein LOC128601490 isoform X1 [Ictalurus furcatus]|uniref:uncharacterized protein LOC128601490 isoform X1 n=1 Tax=Ictalurus furcatus TaxID=66913 RepID=UPI00235019A9|nr:uncharacterized protein LOC128601490 isoform X1 [Ictalurus furcatus]XP_053470718.1 uncharacterized protein LOC128601490 isoform X1 [Ictalurus furcatus]
MESAWIRPCSSRKPPHTPGPTDSQLCGDVQTEKYTSSDGGTSGSVEHITCVNLQKHVKKEENVDEEYFLTPVSVGHVTPVDLQNHVKKEEPEDTDYLYAGTSNSMEDVDQNNGGFERKHVKEEDSEDKGNIRTRTDWEDLQTATNRSQNYKRHSEAAHLSTMDVDAPHRKRMLAEMDNEESDDSEESRRVTKSATERKKLKKKSSNASKGKQVSRPPSPPPFIAHHQKENICVETRRSVSMNHVETTQLVLQRVQGLETTLRQIRKDVDDLRTVVADVLSHVKPEADEGLVALPRPLKTIRELEDLNEQLKNSEKLRNCFRAYMKTMRGSSIGETVRAILQRIGENSLWCMFSLKGSKGGKLALTGHDEVYRLVHDIAERAHGREYTVASCREAIGSYLKNAPARKGGKKHNQS